MICKECLETQEWHRTCTCCEKQYCIHSQGTMLICFQITLCKNCSYNEEIQKYLDSAEIEFKRHKTHYIRSIREVLK